MRVLFIFLEVIRRRVIVNMRHQLVLYMDPSVLLIILCYPHFLLCYYLKYYFFFPKLFRMFLNRQCYVIYKFMCYATWQTINGQ
ncbi:hypothetical protein EUGRSUZ_D01569 [Eucalyptus grandis]|uniref:Uncharacterized protein n=2 Tax=Eucalyptus grandis TaxID=71139 RepID=A0A059CH01_EUCGR|nr:hypothetical protein EUGRSUZ_D01569 [Eucalyptus grandis]